MFAVIIFLGTGLQSAHADDVNGISIQNILVQPSVIKVGDIFTVTATLVNNSTAPIVLESGTCSPTDVEVPFFTMKFDNHTTIKSKNLNCAGVGLMNMLNPGKKLTGTSPDNTISYVATESGTANVTITFQYEVRNQTDYTQPEIGQATISKSVLFTIYDNNTNSVIPTYGGGGSVVTITLDPLEQFKSGVSAEDVKCRSDLILAINQNHSPACVKESSGIGLLLRGWIVGFPHYETVYFMQPDATAHVYVNYFTNHYEDSSPPDLLLHLNSRIYKLDSSFPTNEINATANPDLIHTNSNTIVDYTITSSDTKGVYWLSLSNPCVTIPIVVDIDPSHLSPPDLQNPSDSMSCPPSETQFHIASVSNTTLKLIPVD